MEENKTIKELLEDLAPVKTLPLTFKQADDETFVVDIQISPFSPIVAEVLSTLLGLTTKSYSNKAYEPIKNLDNSAVNLAKKRVGEIVKKMTHVEELKQTITLIRLFANVESVDAKQRKFAKEFSSAIEQQASKLGVLNDSELAFKNNQPVTASEEIKKQELPKSPVSSTPAVPIQTSEIDVPSRLNDELNDIVKAFTAKSKGNTKGKSPNHTSKTFEVEKGINEALNKLKQDGLILEYQFINIALRYMIGQFYPEYAKDLLPLEELNYRTIK